MTGLEKLIEQHTYGSGRARNNTIFNYNQIAKELNLQYKTAKSKVTNATLSVHEAVYLFMKIYPYKYKVLAVIPEFEAFCEMFIDNDNIEE